VKREDRKERTTWNREGVPQILDWVYTLDVNSPCCKVFGIMAIERK